MKQGVSELTKHSEQRRWYDCDSEEATESQMQLAEENAEGEVFKETELYSLDRYTLRMDDGALLWQEHHLLLLYGATPLDQE